MSPSTKLTRPVMGILAILLAFCLTQITAHRPYEQHSFGLEPGRSLAEGEVGRPLADTVRIDPLDNFKKYRGGYNISNKHYWSSTVFTGKYGYGVAIIWLLCGIVYGVVLLVTTLCFSNKKRKEIKSPDCSGGCYFCPIVVGFLFTFLAIIASGVVLGGNSRFYSRGTTVKNIVIDTAEDASETIYNVTGAIRALQQSIGLSDERLNTTSRRRDGEADEIMRQARKNKRWVNLGLKILFATTTAFVSLNLIAILALLVSAFLRIGRVLYCLIILCWIFTALYWMYFGVYSFVEKFAGDTCAALEEYRVDPRNSSLSSILPCDDLLSAESILVDVKSGISDLIDQANANISSQQGSPILSQIRICNPFSGPPDYIYQPQNCPPNTIRIGEVPQIFSGFTCSENGVCREGQFIPGNTFNTILAASTSVQNLLNAIPGMESLVDCQVVKDAISEILYKHCGPVKKFVRMVWASMAVLAAIMVVLLLTWIVKGYHDRRQHFSVGSVKPHSREAHISDSDTKELDVKFGA